MADASSTTYDGVLQKLKSFPPPLLPPGHSYRAEVTGQIASLQVHPTLEAALHILNHDLPSAHFLVRKMQAPPAVEGMTLHAILHRIEGDYDNARAWYKDVASDSEGAKLLSRAWGGDGDAAKKHVLDFVQKVEDLNKKKLGSKDDLAETSRKEIMSVLEWCEGKFGKEKWDDASSAWSNSEKHRQQGQAMTTGGEGYRKF